MGFRHLPRWKALRAAALGTAIVAVVCPAAHATGESGSAPIPTAFTLNADHDYWLKGLVLSGGDGEATFVLVVHRPASGVTYSTPISHSSEGEIEADLGAVGHVDLSFRPSAREVVESGCGKSAVVQGGFYEGTFSFEGEEGFASVVASRVKASARPLLRAFCPERGRSHVSPGPGAGLTARRGSTVTFEATTNGGPARSRFFAQIRERRGRLSIDRFVEAIGPSTGFAYDRGRNRAAIAPPIPFLGRGRFLRSAPPGNRWLGTLSVDFPGHSGVALTGAAFRTQLVSGRFSGHPRG